MISKQGENLAAKAREKGWAFVHRNYFDDSHRYLNYLGDAAIVGAGMGIGWYGLKKTIERAYRRKLEKALREQEIPGTAYEQKNMPIKNELIDSGLKKESSGTQVTKDMQYASRASKDVGADSHGGEYMYIKPGQGLRNTVAAGMAQAPHIWNSAAFAAIPAVFAASAWGSNVLMREAVKKLSPDVGVQEKKQIEKARKKFDRAALLLKSIAREEALTKESSLKKEAFGPLLPLAGGATLIGAGLYGYAKAHKARHEAEGYEEHSPELSNNSVINTLVGLGAGAATLSLAYPLYRFVQSARSGYNDRLGSLSDVTRAAQAWDTVRAGRGVDYAALRAMLADEPDMPEEYREGDLPRKK